MSTLARTSLAALLFAVALPRPCVPAEWDDPRTANGLVRYFTDSKDVSVRSLIQDVSLPVGHVGAASFHWNRERVLVKGIQATPGSQDAVDAITTASRPIHGNAFQDFSKVRDEFQGKLSNGPAEVGYYHSTEPDYLAQQIDASVHRDVHDDQLDVAVGASYGWDEIDPLANDNTVAGSDHKTTLHWNAVATRILSPTAMVRVGIESNLVDGLQHNPYRLVYAGGTSVPEHHPRSRDRRDAFVKYHQYLRNRSSLKLGYRFYTDDWGVVSHESSSRLTQYLTRGMSAQYEYRYYTQTAAEFYRPEYEATTGVGGYLTGDYRLGPLSSHLMGVTLGFDLAQLAATVPALRRFNLSLDYERYFNSNNYSADIVETGIDFRF